MDMWAFAASALIFSRSADAMRVLNLISFFIINDLSEMISFVPSESWGGFKWVWASARKWGVGPCPAQCIWQGSGFAADQTNAMLATSNGGDKISRNRNSLRLSGITVYAEIFHLRQRNEMFLHPAFKGLFPLHTALFRRSCMGVVSLPSAYASCC